MCSRSTSPGFHAQTPGVSENPATHREDLSVRRKSMQRLPHVKNNDASTLYLKETLGVIPTPAGGGRRQKTAPRSNDRGGHSYFPAGPAGDLQKIARRPRGKAPAKRKPAPNGAGGFAGVQRVQWHPSRFSVSAKRTLKIFVGPVRGPLHCPCQWHGQCRGPQGPHDTRSRHPVPGGKKRQEQDGGKGVGIPMAALQAAPPWRIPWGRGKPAGNRWFPFSDRGFTAAVRMAQEAPPACWRCFRGRWRVRMTPFVCFLKT
ncbi:hypothetical protein NDU88_002050 [Pleurodeles waltl]|uniref:Uncharacterized protein n=1 Tax=Pleurodeles waltl TaxID=8319 RepID=A0AAV7M9W5_PLEWA|nr:hypothetical protein NDU88_002050 [Pleurodeles waltl]